MNPDPTTEPDDDVIAKGRNTIRTLDPDLAPWVLSDYQIAILKRDVLAGCERFWEKRGIKEPCGEWGKSKDRNGGENE